MKLWSRDFACTSVTIDNAGQLGAGVVDWHCTLGKRKDVEVDQQDDHFEVNA